MNSRSCVAELPVAQAPVIRKFEEVGGRIGSKRPACHQKVIRDERRQCRVAVDFAQAEYAVKILDDARGRDARVGGRQARVVRRDGEVGDAAAHRLERLVEGLARGRPHIHRLCASGVTRPREDAAGDAWQQHDEVSHSCLRHKCSKRWP